MNPIDNIMALGQGEAVACDCSQGQVCHICDPTTPNQQPKQEALASGFGPKLIPQVSGFDAPQPQPKQEPVYWEWRWFDTSPYTVTSGQWSEWRRVEPRDALQTVDDAVAEFKTYIANGYRYELRALYTEAPQTQREGFSLTDAEIAAWGRRAAQARTERGWDDVSEEYAIGYAEGYAIGGNDASDVDTALLKQALDALELSRPAQCGQSDELIAEERAAHRAAIAALKERLR
jgi:hypothetical protein